MSAAVPGGDRELWCRQCGRIQLAVLRALAGVSVYRCGTCLHWNRCRECSGTMTPDHATWCRSAVAENASE